MVFTKNVMLPKPKASGKGYKSPDIIQFSTLNLFQKINPSTFSWHTLNIPMDIQIQKCSHHSILFG